jgi:hypothetical protein
MKYTQISQPFYVRHSSHIIFGTGLLFLASAVFIYSSQYLFMNEAYRAKGLVIGFVMPRGKTLKTPVIEYYTPDQKQHVYYHSEGTNPPKYQTGDEVTVYYNPQNPEDVILGYSFIPILILSFFGLIFTGVGIAMRK